MPANSGGIATSTQVANSTSTPIASCSSDTSELANVPPLPSNMQWTIATSSGATYSANWEVATSSNDANAIIFRDALNDNMSLQGKAWTATSNWDKPYQETATYLQVLEGYGWSPQINLGGGVLTGVDASGFSGGENGVIKIQNGYFRAIVAEYLRKGVMNIFVSDIAPISQIFPGYKWDCGPSAAPAWGEYHVNAPNGLLLVDPQGRRTGYDPNTNVAYHEIPNTEFSGGQGSNQIIISSIPNGGYYLYVLGHQVPGYFLDIWTNYAVSQRFRGDISSGSAIIYLQNYDAANLVSSTFSLEGISSSTASVTSAPPNNLPPPSVP